MWRTLHTQTGKSEYELSFGLVLFKFAAALYLPAGFESVSDDSQ